MEQTMEKGTAQIYAYSIKEEETVKKLLEGQRKRLSLQASFTARLTKSQSDILVCMAGGIGYGLLEVLWRGRTHWSMVLCGGACLLLIHKINRLLRKRSLFLRSFCCAALITGIEFAVGCVVNLGLGMHVWDYSDKPAQLLGQVCASYSFLWFLLSACLSFLHGLFFPKQAGQKRV